MPVHVGTAEILLDDARRLEAAAESATIPLHVWEGMPHVFPRNLKLKAAREALDSIGNFLKNAR